MSTIRDYLWKNRRHISHKQFADSLGMSISHLSHIVNGHHVPSMALAKKIEAQTNGEVKWHELMQYCYDLSRQEK